MILPDNLIFHDEDIWQCVLCALPLAKLLIDNEEFDLYEA
jgi:hypothetical protein